MKRIKLLLAFVLLVLVISVSSMTYATTYTLTPIDVPGASSTNANGINGSGSIVGSYANATGTHGFLDIGGTFTPIDVPGAYHFTGAYGINSSGSIVGT